MDKEVVAERELLASLTNFLKLRGEVLSTDSMDSLVIPLSGGRTLEFPVIFMRSSKGPTTIMEFFGTGALAKMSNAELKERLAEVIDLQEKGTVGMYRHLIEQEIGDRAQGTATGLPLGGKG